MTRLLYIFGPIPFLLFACGTATPTPATGPATAPAANASTAPGASADCPAPSAACMNQDNHARCLALAKKCPGKVLQLESCPLQFACED